MASSRAAFPALAVAALLVFGTNCGTFDIYFTDAGGKSGAGGNFPIGGNSSGGGGAGVGSPGGALGFGGKNSNRGGSQGNDTGGSNTGHNEGGGGNGGQFNFGGSGGRSLGMGGQFASGGFVGVGGKLDMFQCMKRCPNDVCIPCPGSGMQGLGGTSGGSGAMPGGAGGDGEGGSSGLGGGFNGNLGGSFGANTGGNFSANAGGSFGPSGGRSAQAQGGASGSMGCPSPLKCDTQCGYCVECLRGECPGGFTCDPQTYTCQLYCENSAQCPRPSAREACDLRRHVCVECVGPEDCNGDRCVDSVCVH